MEKQLFNSNKKCRRESGAGFSLIELVVVLAIFFIIMGITVDIFLSMVQRQKRILEEQELLNQTSYVTEYMSKQLRMAVKATNVICLSTVGYIYELTTHCPTYPSQACNGVNFINQLDNNACTEFYLDDTVSPPFPLMQTKNGILTQYLLSNKFKINFARFIVNGNKTLRFASGTAADLFQPRITILLDVQTQSVGNQQQKIIQATVSQRNLIR